MTITEFRVNDYITLKLEDKQTNIYILGKKFVQCKFLLLKIPVKKVSSLYDINSVDEAAEKLNHEMEQKKEIFNISPEVEFWRHSSNLQIWVENNYNTSLL